MKCRGEPCWFSCHPIWVTLAWQKPVNTQHVFPKQHICSEMSSLPNFRGVEFRPTAAWPKRLGRGGTRASSSPSHCPVDMYRHVTFTNKTFFTQVWTGICKSPPRSRCKDPFGKVGLTTSCAQKTSLSILFPTPNMQIWQLCCQSKMTQFIVAVTCWNLQCPVSMARNLPHVQSLPLISNPA